MKKIDLKISKELLSEVFKLNICEAYIENNNLYFDMGLPLIQRINLYEFAFKCKEWALKKEFIVHSSPTQKIECTAIAQNFNMNHSYYGQNQFYALTEIEAIIKACEWILENSK
ncbi:hypothetical protein QUR79_00535 [Arcobacter cryaerophilus gv. pseudocryaerophilus]|uniref:Uncharacterized protein n=2 Tax=Arcobacteraceae TaxID=2808963 RepID=A0AAU0P4L6_9BACT|nr:hypothetical protein RJG54_08685 [Arcobacter sp. AZ-2023]WPD03398.1 hypothetical protein QUR79_00535 [Arcobacter sp. DSM 115972]